MSDLGFEDYTAAFLAALRVHELQIHLTWTVFPHRNAVGLYGPGATPRSKPVRLVPLIVGDEGKSHADILRLLAEAMEGAGRD